MSPLNDHGLFREAIVLLPAWRVIAAAVSSQDPRDADPQSVFGAACAADPDRLAGLVYWDCSLDSFDEAKAIVGEVLAMAAVGRRPRAGYEIFGGRAGVDAAIARVFGGGDAA